MFQTKSGLSIAKGYRRIVIGRRGPYVEFDHDNINFDKFFIPCSEMWREHSDVAFYNEWRSVDSGYVKLYHQKKLVNYADYLIDKYYISPYDLYVKGKCCIGECVEETNALLEFY
jgi:hypothetical protein